MELVPGVSAGPFVLGATLGATMGALRAMAAGDHSGTNVGGVDLVCARSGSQNVRDIVLSLTSHGLCLRVDSDEQTLRLIELFSLQSESSAPILFQGIEISSPRTLPSLRHIFKRLGPTYPGTTNEQRTEYILAYPGIAFVFPMAGGKQTQNHARETTTQDAEDATPRPDTPASRIYLFDAHTSQTRLPRDFITATRAPLLRARAMAAVRAVCGGGGLEFAGGMVLRFGDSAQDVMAVLGAPGAVFWKTADVAVGGGAGVEDDSCAGGLDEYCLWNYFGFGVDVVFGSANTAVERFVLHANLPLHHAFGRYTKCRFEISVNGNESSKIKSSSTWTEIQGMLGPAVKHMVYDRDMGQSPFGASEYFGYEKEGLIFEVVSGDSVASVVVTRA
ncbi:hypothetical protein HDU84_004196 [Entophlyctis sp. JEL0112]|nr:hypothetical protein HDU84_004196 [Entophlyctis sp. JEL0112]